MAELLSGPLMSIALVILAGIALRYALWMGRDRESESGGRMPALEQRNGELVVTIERSNARLAELGAENARIKEDYQSLRAALDSREPVPAESFQLGEVSGELTATLREQIVQLESSKAEAETQLADALASLSDADGRSAGLNQQLDELRSALSKQSDDRHGLLCQRDALLSERNQLAAERDAFAERVDVEAQRAASAESMYSQAGDLQSHLQADLESAQERYKLALSECTKLQTALHESELTIAELSNRQLGESVEAAEKLRAVEAANRELTNELSAMRSASMEANQEIEAAQQELALLQTEVRFVGQLRSERSQLLTELDKIKKHAASMQHSHKQHVQSISEQHRRQLEQFKNLQVEKDELTLGLRREQENLVRLSAELDAVRKQARKTELEASHLDLLREDHRCVSEELQRVTALAEKLQSDHETLSTALVAARQELQQTGDRATKLQGDFDKQTAIAAEMRQANDAFQIELARTRTEKKTLEQLLTVHSETLQRLRADSLSIETLLERQSAVQESLQEHADRLRSVALDDPSPAPVEIRNSGAAKILSFQGLPETGDSGRVDRVLGLVYDHAPQNPDDLKRISGVGVTLEEKLNRLGFFRYEQIMNLSEEGIVELSKLLALKDRIGRDDWVGQARRLFLSSGSQVA